MASRLPTLKHPHEPPPSAKYATARAINGAGVPEPGDDGGPGPPAEIRSAAPGALPPERGRGSGKAAWMGAALRLKAHNEGQASVIEAQGAVICDMQSEIAALKRQAAQHRPALGRAKSLERRVEHSYFHEIRHRSWARRHRLVVLIALEAAILVIMTAAWLLRGG